MAASELLDMNVTGVVTQSAPATTDTHLVRKGEMDTALALKAATAALASYALLVDPRFTDARTALAHAPSHKLGGSDPIKLNELALPTASVDCNSQKLTNVGTPLSNGDATNKSYVAAQDALLTAAIAGKADLAHATRHKSGGADALALHELAVPTAYVGLNGQKITGLAAPSVDTDAATKGYVDTADAALTAALALKAATSALASYALLVDPRFTDARTALAHAPSHKSGGSDPIKLNELAQPTAAVYFASQKATFLGSAAIDSDGANLGDVRRQIAQSGFKLPCRFATTGPVSLSGTGATNVDVGVSTLVAGDRILVKDQADTTQNGIYVAATYAWARATDADDATELYAGCVVPVQLGATNGGRCFMNTVGALGGRLTFARVDLLVKLSDLAAPTSAVSMGSQRLTNVAAPTDASDASNKSYVDAMQTVLQGMLNAALANTLTTILPASKTLTFTSPNGTVRWTLGINDDQSRIDLVETIA